MDVLSRRLWLLVGGVWLSLALWISRFAVLDDSFIHLRYAEHLRSIHRISYDGVHTSYGASSLLYVSILAILRVVSNSPLLPKAVSVVFYLGLIAIIYRQVRLLTHWTITKLLWISTLLCVLSPMGVRWLTDGMETSLGLLLAAVTAIFCAKFLNRPIKAVDQLLFFLLGAMLVMCRLEMCSLILLCAVNLAFCSSSEEEKWPRAITRSLGLLGGAALAILTIWRIFGHILPDTAVAKSGKPSLKQIIGVAHVSISSFELGIGLTVLAAISAWCVLREIVNQGRDSGTLISWAAANACYVVVVIAACLRGQSIEGIRYFLWPLMFSITWNSTVLSGLETKEGQRGTHSDLTLLRWYAVLAVCLLPFDLYYGMHSILGRDKTFLTMRNANLPLLSGTNIVAGDIGFIGYFTGASICDLGGLVNGRAVAALNADQRYQRCASPQPGAAFLTIDQMKGLSHDLDLSGWRTCLVVDFQKCRKQ